MLTVTLSAAEASIPVWRYIHHDALRTGVIGTLLTADSELRAVWRRMPLRTPADIGRREDKAKRGLPFPQGHMGRHDNRARALDAHGLRRAG